MPKVSVRQRELKKRITSDTFNKRRRCLLKARTRVCNLSQQLEVFTALETLPRNSIPARQSNRCGLTGTSRSYNRLTGLSRHQLRELGHQSMIPGLFKAAW